ncbi:MAG: hypothetical protein ACM3SY_02695 [Candidatus Omnitrophota bacterium]
MVEEGIELLRVILNCFSGLSEEQLRRIENAKKELANGLTNAQADKIVDEWLQT